jgi:hypothetical protein
MSRCNYDELQGGAEDGSEELQYGWRNTHCCTTYEHRGTSSLTPAEAMNRQTYYGYAQMSLVQGMNVLQLLLLHLASYLHLRLFLGRIGHSMEKYASAIWAKMQDIKDCAETLFFHIRWILGNGGIALLYAEDLSV